MNSVILGLTLMLGGQDALSKRIEDQEYLARPVNEVLSDLARECGALLVATDGVGSEPVFLSLKDRTVRQTMDHLAYVCDGEWIESNGAFTLRANRAPGPEAAISNAELTVRAAMAKRVVKPWNQDSVGAYMEALTAGREAMNKNVRGPEGEQVNIDSSGQTPAILGDLLLVPAMAQLGARLLAEIPEGSRRVWSTNPNRRQLAFPGNLGSAIDQYRGAIRDIFHAAQKDPLPDFGKGWGGDFGLPTQAETSVSKVNVIAYRSTSSLVVGVQVIAPDGSEVAFFADQIQMSSALEQTAELTDKGEVGLSPATQQLLAVRESARSGRGISMMMQTGEGMVRLQTGVVARNVKLEPGIQAILDAPARLDFLNLLVGESMAELNTEEEYIALVPDQLWSDLYAAANTGTLLKSRARAAWDRSTVSTSVAGIQRIRPVDSGLARALRIDRGNLRDLIASTRRQGHASLQASARYVAGRGRVVGSLGPDAILLTVGEPFLADVLLSTLGNNYADSVFLAACPDLMRLAEAHTLAWEFAKMSVPMQRALESMIFNRQLSPTMGGSATNISVDTGPISPKMASESEATERFSDGIPADFVVSGSIKDEDGVLGRIRGQQTGRMLTGTAFGALTGFIEGQGGNQGEFPMTQFEEFLPAKVREFAFELPGGYLSYSDGKLVPGARALAANELPSAFLQRGDLAREMMRSAAESMSRQRGQVKPPALN